MKIIAYVTRKVHDLKYLDFCEKVFCDCQNFKCNSTAAIYFLLGANSGERINDRYRDHLSYLERNQVSTSNHKTH